MHIFDDSLTRKSNSTYIASAMKAPLLDKGREQDLARRWRDSRDQTALSELITSHGRLVVAMASRFRHYGLSLADLIQEGNIGLMIAASRFDADRDIRFSTYASWWIRSSIQDFVLRNWSIVRTGTTAAHKSLFFNLRRLRARIARVHGHDGPLNDDDRDAIAREMNVTEQDVALMDGRLSGGDQSLNAVMGVDGEAEFQDFLSDDRPTPEEIVITTKDTQTRTAWLNEALRTLSEREKTIMAYRHLSDTPVTLEDLGNKLGISKERVRQLEQRALTKLKNALEPHRASMTVH